MTDNYKPFGTAQPQVLSHDEAVRKRPDFYHEEYKKLGRELSALMNNPETKLKQIADVQERRKAFHGAHVYDKCSINSDAAQCLICDHVPDEWYCPKAPDHLCHYDNGDPDQCDFCGQPQERK